MFVIVSIRLSIAWYMEWRRLGRCTTAHIINSKHISRTRSPPSVTVYRMHAIEHVNFLLWKFSQEKYVHSANNPQRNWRMVNSPWVIDSSKDLLQQRSLFLFLLKHRATQSDSQSNIVPVSNDTNILNGNTALLDWVKMNENSGAANSPFANLHVGTNVRRGNNGGLLNFYFVRRCGQTVNDHKREIRSDRACTQVLRGNFGYMSLRL